MNAREAFHAWMKAHGIEHVFGNPGSTEIPALVGWPDGVRYVLGLQESVVVATADAYAQARGRCALVSLHAAQGLGNAIGALRTAARNRAPMVVLVGQEDARHQVLAPLLYGDMVSLAQPVVKWAYEVEDSADLVAALERAWHLAGTTPAGPVMLSVPANLWDGPATPTAARARRAAQAVDEGALGEVMAAMASSRAPALVMGSGVARADAFGVAVALAQRLQCPVYGAPLAERIGFPNRHSLYEGTLPPALPLILQTLSRHDAVFVFGAPAFLCYPYLPGPRTLPMPVYHVDDDPEHLAASLAQRTYLHALGPALASLSAIAPQAEARAGATAARAARRRSDAVRARARMGVPYVLDDIARTVPSGTTVIDEAVSSSPLVREYLPVEGPRQYFTAATGGLGWGIGAAAGAALASPGRKVLALVGDGASLYGVQGLWTLGRFGLPVGVVVLDNGLYSILQSFGRMLYPGREDTMPGLELQGIDLVRIAEGLAVPAWRIEDAPALEERLTDLWQRPGPFLLDVAVAPQPVSLA